MKQLPIFLTVKDRPCLLVGGGKTAARKAKLLRKAGARIIVVAPRLDAAMSTLVQSNALEHRQRTFINDDLQDMTLVIAATEDHTVNQKIATLAKDQNLLCNVADAPDGGNFSLPSIVNRDPINIAISGGGASPVLSRLLQARIEAFIPASYGKLARLTEEFKEEIKSKLTTHQARRRFLENTLSGNTAEQITNGQHAAAKATFKAALEKAHTSANNTHAGEVYLVGAGPGNPDLLTFRALRLMQQADVVLYDRLVAASILNLCNENAEHIYVGKKRAEHTMQQIDINQTLIDFAKQGKRVLRLKGGDPFIFGRGGEEIESLAQHNIPFQVVPGITAASGCASYAGIPLTHRDHAQSCTFFTGHLKDGSVDLDWHKLTDPGQTLVCYMGLIGLPIICTKLIKHGMAPDTPAALIERGTTADQQVYTGTVSTLPAIIASHQVTAPTLIIIGSVVTLRDKLNWMHASS